MNKALHVVAAALSLMAVVTSTASAKTLKAGVVQTVIEDTLEKNLDKLIHFIDQAKREGCQLVVFPENALYWADHSVDDPTKADIDRALDRIGRRAEIGEQARALGYAASGHPNVVLDGHRNTGKGQPLAGSYAPIHDLRLGSGIVWIDVDKGV